MTSVMAQFAPSGRGAQDPAPPVPGKRSRASRPLAPKKAVKKIPGALSVFRWTVKHLYLTDKFQRSLTSQYQISLYAFYKQATVGPNDLPAPTDLSFSSAVNDPVSSTLALPGAIGGGALAMGKGMTNAAVEILTLGGLFGSPISSSVELAAPTPVQWQAWKNLGSMRKDEAVDLFLETIAKINPDFMDTQVDHELDEAAGPAFALDGSGTKILSIREIIIRNGIVRIQSLVRGYCGKRRCFLLHAKKRAPQVQELLALLLKGIPVYKLPAFAESADGPLRKRSLVLKMGSTIASSRLGLTSGMGTLSDHKVILLGDLADVRAGCSSHGFVTANSSAAKVLANKCLSLIGTKGTLDLALNHDGFSRSWFVYSFLLLIDSALTHEDIRNRGRLPAAKLRFSPIFIPPGLRYDGSRVAALLEASFGVEEYLGQGKCVLKSLWVNREARRFYLAVMGPKGAENPKGIDIDDVAEIRCGLISAAIDSGDAVFNDRVLSIIGSETTLVLALSSRTLRDKLARRLNIFLAVSCRCSALFSFAVLSSPPSFLTLSLSTSLPSPPSPPVRRFIKPAGPMRATVWPFTAPRHGPCANQPAS